MKKVFPLLLLVLVLSACAAPVAGAMNQAVDLPNTVEADIYAVVLVGLSWVFVQLVTLLPFLKFLEDFKVPLAAALASQLIGFFEGAVPDQYGAVAILGLQLVLAVIALFLTVERLRVRGVKGFK